MVGLLKYENGQPVLRPAGPRSICASGRAQDLSSSERTTSGSRSRPSWGAWCSQSTWRQRELPRTCACEPWSSPWWRVLYHIWGYKSIL